ncbi:MAG TPA: anti-sigma factor [Flavisolibacter sp.]|jgi:anti-sigma-K factor RskA|nr:anti-sigma factor [Flavisolibacter sp.]
MNVKEYISSGIIESYVLGLASEAESQEFEQNCVQYPEIAQARTAFEIALEEKMLEDAVAVPLPLKQKIDEKIKSSTFETATEYLEDERTPVRQIGAWRWIAAASLILLVVSLYWTISTTKKYRDLQAQNKELQEKIQQSTAQVSDMQDDMEKLKHPMKTAALKSEDDRAYAIVYWDTVSASRNVYLMINNLPQAPTDKQYQLWALLNNEPIDLGMIEVKQKRLLYQMKNVQNAQAFAITLEPKGGSEKPTTAPIALSNL